jgi:hypothetical protein
MTLPSIADADAVVKRIFEKGGEKFSAGRARRDLPSPPGWI